MIQRKRAELLQFDYILEHRPARMMIECDVLSRYNGITESWRETARADSVSLAVPPSTDTVSPSTDAEAPKTTVSLAIPRIVPEPSVPFYALPVPTFTGPHVWPSAHDEQRACDMPRCYTAGMIGTEAVDSIKTDLSMSHARCSSCADGQT